MSDTSGAHGTSFAKARPGTALDGVAADAWQAYNAMETTKRRHVGLLERLELKMRNYSLDPSVDEARLLEWLLADHDAQVKRFAQASLTLKASDEAAHAALFEYVGLLARSEPASDAANGARHAH